MRRAALPLIAGAALLTVSAPLAAQEEAEADDGNLVIDILVEPPEPPSPSEAEIRECEAEIDAARVTREIIVCRQIVENPNDYYSGSRADARRNYAEETVFAGTIAAPDVAGEGIFRGEPSISGLCFFPPCPKDPALMIDVEALPEAPSGSDADRIAQGLVPLGSDDELSAEEIQRRLRALENAVPPQDEPE
ncbi:hypothetical protein [Erythrobacter sp. MTPC3]|uniref:hypothetical protein n=1 Tax=Erythrobacter sp. MTPC3 TaxID=3056564 RepID=UPI0036F2B2B1